MKIFKNANSKFLRNADGKLLKIRPEDTFEPNPDLFQFVVEVDEGQSITLPTPNSFVYYNQVGGYVNSGNLIYDYVVDWGDNTATVNITSYNSPDAIHVYQNAGKYLISIASTTQKFPAFDCSLSAYSDIRLLITNVISWGNVGLKRVSFASCTALTTLPEQRSKLTTLLTANSFCSGCTSLTTIPYGTFFATETEEIVISDFTNAFYNNAKLRTIHSTIFKDAFYARNFQGTFGTCGKITAIPEVLFSSCPNVTSFASTFQNCYLIESIPAGLFEFNTYQGCNFSSTFYSCTSVTFVPAGLFDNVKSISFSSTFYNCTNLETIPSYLFKYQQYCTSFSQTFSLCRKLQIIPVGVFDVSVDGVNSCTSMAYTFQYCGTDASVTDFNIPSGLFDDLYKVTSFYRTFYQCSKFSGIPSGLFNNCVSVTDFRTTFYNNAHTSIPIGLFDNCTEVTNFSGTFSNNSELTSDGIPDFLFENNIKVINFGESSSGGVFQNCSNVDFTYIPATIFRANSNVSSFYAAFYGCTHLESIPTDLLRYNTVATTVYNMFYNTSITSLSANVFQYNRSITDVSGCFSNCSLLTTIDEGLFDTYQQQTNAIVSFASVFSGCSLLASIPANLFQYCVNAKIFNNAFYNCIALTSIPATLFSTTTIIENLAYCFYNLQMVTTIPTGIFAGLTQVSNLSYCFFSWNALTSMPVTLFDDIGLNRTVNFSYCLYISTTATYNNYTGAVTELWNKPYSPLGTHCFGNRTAVSNYANIPADWK